MEYIPILYPNNWTEYELIDSGNGEKLERFGNFIIIRPDPRIIWNKSNPNIWGRFDARFIRTSNKDGSWDVRKNPPENWIITYNNLKFRLKPTEFKHTGVFPEQAVNWEWLSDILINNVTLRQAQGLTNKILNLFAYTGGATMACLSAGAEVTHVDSSGPAISWASENLKLSGLENKPIRWIKEDVEKFMTREIRRGNKYDGIIMDPPRFGRGDKGEVFKLEKDLPKLLEYTSKLLSDKPVFFLINAYTADLSHIALANAVGDITRRFGGHLVSGELGLMESSGKKLVPNGVFARWNK